MAVGSFVHPSDSRESLHLHCGLLLPLIGLCRHGSRCHSGLVRSMNSIVSAFISAPVWIPFFGLPGMLSIMSGNGVLFQAGSGQCALVFKIDCMYMSNKALLNGKIACLSNSPLLVIIYGPCVHYTNVLHFQTQNKLMTCMFINEHSL